MAGIVSPDCDRPFVSALILVEWTMSKHASGEQEAGAERMEWKGDQVRPSCGGNTELRRISTIDFSSFKLVDTPSTSICDGRV